jgi:hypothetical protein
MTIPTLQVRRASAAIFIPGIILADFATTLLVVGGSRLSAVGVLALVYGGIVIVAAGLVSSPGPLARKRTHLQNLPWRSSLEALRPVSF